MTDQRDERDLVAKILARDRRALSFFYRHYTPRLSALIRQKIDNQGDAEEVLQDTLFAFLEAIRDFQGNSQLSTFLYAIGNHKIIDYYRRRKLRQVVFSRTPNLEALISPMLNPEEELDTTIMKEKIHRGLARIMPRYRQLIVSKYEEDLSVAEIAKKFALSLKGAESQLFRARKAFVALFLSI